MKTNRLFVLKGLVIIIMMFLQPDLLYAQTGKGFFDMVFERMELRESFGSAATKNEPVRLHFTLPKDGEASYAIDGALGLPFFDVPLSSTLNLTGKVIGEYHRNTLLDEQQFNWQAGFSTTLRTKIRHNANNTYTQWLFTPTFKYSRNVLDTSNSLSYTMDIIPFRTGEKGINLNTYTIRGNRSIIALVSINPAFEFQHHYSAAQKDNNGDILRPILKSQYSLGGNKRRSPATTMVEPIKTWEASVDYTIRYALINSTQNREKFTYLLETGLDYYFVTAPISVAFGISFNYGSDPLQGLNKQQFWLATISIQK
jgi:hypothetical protein